MLPFNAIKIRHYLERKWTIFPWCEPFNCKTSTRVVPFLSTGDSGSTCLLLLPFAFCQLAVFVAQPQFVNEIKWRSVRKTNKNNGRDKRTCRHHHNHTKSPAAGLLSPETTAPGRGTKTNFKSSTPKANTNLHSLYFPSAIRPWRSISRDLTCLQICTEGMDGRTGLVKSQF